MNSVRIDHSGGDRILLEITPDKSSLEWGFLIFAGLLALGVSVVWVVLLANLLAFSGSTSAKLLALVFFVLLFTAWRSLFRQALGKEVFIFQKKQVGHYWQLPFYKDKHKRHPFTRLEIVYSRSRKGARPETDERLVDDFMVKKEEVALGLVLDGEPLVSWLMLSLSDVETLNTAVDDLLKRT